MKIVATVYMIENGYLVAEEETGRHFFLPEFDIECMNIQPQAHENILRNKIMAMDAPGNKIPAIKMVRDYCVTHNYDRYRGLKDAKDFVESLRNDWSNNVYGCGLYKQV